MATSLRRPTSKPAPKTTRSALLAAEIQWIMGHPERYEGPMHQRAVIGNIEKRYFETEARRRIQRWETRPTTGNGFAVLEHFGLD